MVQFYVIIFLCCCIYVATIWGRWWRRVVPCSHWRCGILSKVHVQRSCRYMQSGQGFVATVCNT